MSEEIRKGRQTPTVSRVLPYSDSRGAEAAELYNRTGRTAQEWQERMIEDIMAVNPDGLWVHMKAGWSIPRRNGKSEILIMRCLWDITNGRRTLYTAHRESTAAMAWEKTIRFLAKIGFKEDEDFKSYKSAGRRSIEWLRDDTEAVVNFRTRTSTGGLGEGYDTLIIDEAQEYTADQESALKYVVTDSKNPQTLMCGTPPTAVSSGDVFLKYRKRVLTGGEDDAAWMEWSVPNLTDAHDPELWYLTNPSLGTILTERTIRSELGDDQVDDNIQRLGLWLRYNQKSAISREEWERCALAGKPELPEEPRLFFAVKYSRTGTVSLAVAAKTADEACFLECIDCRAVKDGDDWMMPYFRNPHTEAVCIDGAGNSTVLCDDMTDAQIACTVCLPTVKDVIAANALFEQQLFAANLRHAGQPALSQAAENSEHRAIGSGGGFGYTSILEGADISLLEAAALAVWMCLSAKEPVEQIITY